MLEKTMKSLLIKKVNKWIESITDEDVAKSIKEDLIITGGCFTSFIQNETPNDFDCYFRTRSTVLKVAQYYANLWNDDPKHNREVEVRQETEGTKGTYVKNGRISMFISSAGVAGDLNAINAATELGVDSIEEITEEIEKEEVSKEKKSFFPVFISENAITLSDQIQIVVRFWGEPSEIHETYDFLHTRAFFDYREKKLEVPREVYECVINKTLIYTGSRYPVCSLFRMRKFIERGWKINAGQILKIALQVSELDLTDIEVLRDQLIGVDSLYFMNLIAQFRNKKASNPDWELTPNYIISIVDKIF